MDTIFVVSVYPFSSNTACKAAFASFDGGLMVRKTFIYLSIGLLAFQYCGPFGASVTNNNLAAGNQYLTSSAVTGDKILTSYSIYYSGTTTGVIISFQLYNPDAGTTIDLYPISNPISGNWYAITGEWHVPEGWQVRLLVINATSGDDAAFRAAGYTLCAEEEVEELNQYLILGFGFVSVLLGQPMLGLLYAMLLYGRLVPAGFQEEAALILLTGSIISKILNFSKSEVTK